MFEILEEHIKAIAAAFHRKQDELIFGELMSEESYDSNEPFKMDTSWTTTIRTRRFGLKLEIADEELVPEVYSALDFHNDLIPFGNAIEESGIAAVYNHPDYRFNELPKTNTITTTKDEIKFNGAPITDVISYDEQAGEVHYYERHWSSGELIVDGTNPTGYRTIRDKGKVEVVKKHVDPPSNPSGGGSPTDGCDPGWYPYGSPCFAETVNVEVSFEYTGRHTVAYEDRAGYAKTSTASVVSKLKVDGQDLGDYWTIGDVKEDKGSLVICFVKLQPSSTKLSYLCVDPSYLDPMNLRHKAYEVSGYPHIYKVVRIHRADFGLSATVPDVWEPSTWHVGTSVVVLPTPTLTGVVPRLLSVMRKLC